MDIKKPTIKGIFVNSHINNLRIECGEEGLEELARRYNKPFNFRNSDNVPVSEEVRIIEHALDILSKERVPEDKRSFEAGRLHFRNFTKTPLGRIILSVFRKNFKLMMLRSKYIAEHVFRGVKFSTEELGPKEVKVMMENNDYPLDHFKGLFQEWMDFSGYNGVVEGYETTPNHYEYIMKWQ